MKIRSSALIGLGAVGMVYGRRLFDAYGSGLSVIAGGERGRVLRERGAVLNGEAFFPRVVAPEETEFHPDLLLVAVKNYQLDEAMEDIKNAVGENTLILPLLNGITAKDALQTRFPDNRVFYGLSIYIDAIRTEEGVVNSADGIVRFGDEKNTPPAPEVLAVREYLEAAGIKTEVCPDMVLTVWKKWMLNVGCNQVSAVTGALRRSDAAGVQPRPVSRGHDGSPGAGARLRYRADRSGRCGVRRGHENLFTRQQDFDAAGRGGETKNGSGFFRRRCGRARKASRRSDPG
jgi:ketopantoate reductase